MAVVPNSEKKKMNFCNELLIRPEGQKHSKAGDSIGNLAQIKQKT